MKTGLKLIQRDRLAAVFQSGHGLDRQLFCQGLRVPADCQMTPEERRAYSKANGNPIAAIMAIQNGRGVSLSEAAQIFQSARGQVERFHDRHQYRYSAYQ